MAESPGTASLSTWIDRFWQDLQPTPGRLNGSLRIVLSTVLTLLLLMTLRMPSASVGLYFVFLVGRDSPSVSLRSGLFSVVTFAFTAATVIGVVALTDNNPMARLLSVSIVVFLSGMLMLSTNISVLASIWGFIYCTLIAFWETHASSDFLVKQSLYIVGTVSIAVLCSVAVEYCFGVKNPASELQKQRRIRYEALSKMFSLYAQAASREQLVPAVTAVSRLAASGQNGMLELYNIIVDRKLDPGALPIGTRVRITMLAQLMDVSAAFGTQNLTVTDPELQRRCGHIAALCLDLIHDIRPSSEELEEQKFTGSINLLDRVDENLHAILSMPADIAGEKDKELVALPSNKVPLFIPGAFTRKETVAFALKLSLCATICYIIVRAVDWPGISTSVITVVIAGLSTSGAIKQKLIFRLIGAIIGGLFLGLGATIYLFPHMDSITSLVLLIAAVAMLSAWWAAGRQFNYVGLQIAFAFYIVAFEGFSAPTQLAPARDRLVGILLALVVMAFVFDLLWPVRTVTAMRSSLASMMDDAAKYLRMANDINNIAELRQQADALRDRMGKTVGAIRTMNETVEYEFGVDVKQQLISGNMILGAALTLVAFFWNQFAVLHRKEDFKYLTQPELIVMRSKMAEGMDMMAKATINKTEFAMITPGTLASPSLLADPVFGEFARNAVDRYCELEEV
ncbi:MAG TPA: FUSC family protein, partial [Granulicella sp.]